MRGGRLALCLQPSAKFQKTASHARWPKGGNLSCHFPCRGTMALCDITKGLLPRAGCSGAGTKEATGIFFFLFPTPADQRQAGDALCCANCKRSAGPLICHSSPAAGLCQFHAAAERDSDEPLRRPSKFENARALHVAGDNTNTSVGAGMETPATGPALCLFCHCT